MNKTELLTDLQSKPDVLHIVDDNPQPVNVRGNIQWYDIPLIRSLGDNFVQGASQPIIVVDEGQAGEVAYYNGRKNFSEPKRDPLYTGLEIIQKIEQENTGWTVIDMSVDVHDGYDTAKASIDNGTEVVERQYRVWEDTTVEEWVQPTGAHDAYNDLNQLVLHNGKVWKNTHGSGNSWEPGASGIGDSIWMEVDASELMKVKPTTR